jgi:hypothetical protein
MDVRGGRPVDQQAEQSRAAVVAANVHQPLARVDLDEVEIDDHLTFAGLQRLADDLALRVDDGGVRAPPRLTLI